MFIKLHFSRKDFLTIKLFDNSAAHKWFSFYSLRHNNKSVPINFNDNYNNIDDYKKHKKLTWTEDALKEFYTIKRLIADSLNYIL